ncbi:MAG: class I SAM-dependent methyltransferase [Desulfobacterales bacterium]|nr:class I SAM-dependent methyltransferase [Desulfobacterales bacterium]
MTDQYEAKAGEWDEIPWKIELAEEVFSAICAKVKIRPDTRLVDLGGGTGLLTLKFKEHVSNITVVDSSAAMLGVLREKIKTQDLSNIEIIAAELSPGTLPPCSCDLILSMLTLHHIEDLRVLFTIFYATLAPGGNIALVDLAREDGDFHPAEAEYFHNGFETAALRTPLEKAGFKNIEIDTFASITRKTDSGDTKKYPILLVSAVKPQKERGMSLRTASS